MMMAEAAQKVHVLNPFDHVRSLCQRIATKVGERVVGQEETVQCITAGLLLADGHVLLEGVPGLAKSLAVQSLAQAIGGTFHRVQFTPDLLPSDLLGTHVYSQKSGEWTVREGPIFGHFVLADEINRAPAKVQSALLEAMQERQVSLAGETRALPSPFLVLATQNPIEHEGTYPLPEAQIDRFMLKLVVGFPTEDEMIHIVARTAGAVEQEISKIADGDQVIAAGKAIRQMPVAEHVARYAVRLVFATHPDHPTAPACNRRYVKAGASPRAAQAVLAVAKFFALLDGRLNVAVEDVQKAAYPCLRHRILLNFDALADDATTDTLIRQTLMELDRKDDPSPSKAKKK
jgi:MoxR-like ATPase